MSNSFESYTLRHPLLQNHIAYIYFEKYDNINFLRKYSFYPHLYTCISCYNNVRTSFNDNIFHVEYEKSAEPLLRLTQQRSMHTVKQSGPINKIAIVFKPLGINHFIKEDYIQVASAERQEFSPNNVALWKNVIQHCFDEDNPDKRIKLIEAFLLELHQPKDLTVLENVITKLSDVDNSATVEEIAVEANLSRRTLLRMFKKNLGMSPEMYRMIVRFRYAVNHKLKYHHKDNLTALAYESGFTDQSFMNRTFKKFTHCTPKQFFNLGIRLGSEDTFWRIH